MILSAGRTVTAGDLDRLMGAAGPRPEAGTEDLPEGAPGTDPGAASLLGAVTFEAFKEAAERSYLIAKLREHDWNVSETARSIQMPRSNLYKKIERYGLSREAQ